MKLAMMVVAAAMALAAMAQGTAKPDRSEAMRSIEPVVKMALNPKMTEKLGVSEAQVAKLKALADNREALKGLHEKVKKGMNRQTELLLAEKIDEAAVMAALDATWDARKEIARLQTKRLVAVRSILTAEQIAKARAAMKAMRGKSNRPNAGAKRAPKAGAGKDGDSSAN